MKKVGILTIIGNNNYGNRLQNYAVQEVLKKLNFDVETILNNEYSNNKKFYVLRKIKRIIKNDECIENIKRYNNFKKFNNNIKFSDYKVNAYSKNKVYDYVLVGSDQVWNPYHGRLRDVDLLKFVQPKKRIAFSASFGINEIPLNYEKKCRNEFNKFKCISVREDAGEKIVKKLTDRKDVVVLIDPTMLLNANEWDKIAKKPDMLKNHKYILNYFLGNLSQERNEEIKKVAKENNCEIINILDKKSPYYECGPSEFLYLEKNAFLVCTDSFHSSVFAILFNTPFLVFEREDAAVSMNSRIETLLSKFKLEDRKYNGKIEKRDLIANYNEAYRILEIERKKANDFLIKGLDKKENDNNE